MASQPIPPEERPLQETTATPVPVEPNIAPSEPSAERPIAPVDRPALDAPRSTPSPAPSSFILHPSSFSTAAQERRFVELINQDREERGIAPLEVAQALVEVARAHSQEMARRNYFDHYSPTPGLRTPLDRVKQKVPSLRSRPLAVGENIYYCSSADVQRGHHTLMQSPPHREALLNRTYRYVGVGIWRSPNGEFWVTELFASTV